jgi:sugar phosphate isomerase/epimerase
LTDKIKQVHIKDRIRNPLETVEPTTGDTDFELIFNYLKQIKYDGLFTLQTARMESGKEIDTIKRHKRIIEEIYNEQFV